VNFRLLKTMYVHLLVCYLNKITYKYCNNLRDYLVLKAWMGRDPERSGTYWLHQESQCWTNHFYGFHGSSTTV